MQHCCADRNIIRLSETVTTRLSTGFLVTAAALDGIGSTLQPLCRLYSVIYELSGNNLILSVLVAGLISVVMSWFPHFWSFSELAQGAILEQVHMKMLWFWSLPPPLSSSLLEVFVIQSALFVQLENSAGLLQQPTSPDPEVSWRRFSWILNCPEQPVRAC